MDSDTIWTLFGGEPIDFEWTRSQRLNYNPEILRNHYLGIITAIGQLFTLQGSSTTTSRTSEARA